MEWFVFALLAPMMFAVCNIFDKFILTKKIKDPYSYNIIAAALNVIPLAILILHLNVTFDFSALLAILYGAVFTGLYVIYNKAMMKEEASRIISLMYTYPIFVLILSSIFLREILKLPQYFGIILLVASAILVSYNRTKKKFYFSVAIALILFYSFGTASMKVLTKYALSYTDYWSFFFWSLVGNLVGCLVLIIFAKIRKNLISDTLKMDKGSWTAVILANIFAWSGYLFLFIATSLGQVSLVAALLSVQPLIVFIFTLVLTIFMPKILKEEINRESLLFKLLAVIFILAGSYLIVV